MSHYHYKGKPAAPASVLNIEQERRRNAEMALTLRSLELERQSLESEAERVLSVLTALRSTVDRNRAETTRIAAYREAIRKMPPPIHGGREGLLAATAEMEAFESKKTKPRKARKTSPHGTKRRYYVWGCRCEPCTQWAEQQSAVNAERYQRRKQAA